MLKDIFWSMIVLLVALMFSGIVAAQSRHNSRGADLEGTIVSVTAWRNDGNTDPIRPENLFLYENGIEQRIKNFSFDPSPAKIVLLVDNSQTVGAETERLKQTAMEFAYEIFDGDQIFVVAYDEKPEIIQEWTDDAEKLQASMGTFRKKGNPHLFDAINATVREVLRPLMPGTRKTAIVVIGDGLDRGSTTEFDKMLAELQFMNITVYSLQLPDRTGGAYRRNQPKAASVIAQLTEGTGGRAFPIDAAQEAAKAICDELRQRRYMLSYLPTNTSSYEPRRLFLTADTGIELRTKTFQPPNIK